MSASLPGTDLPKTESKIKRFAEVLPLKKRTEVILKEKEEICLVQEAQQKAAKDQMMKDQRDRKKKENAFKKAKEQRDRAAADEARKAAMEQEENKRLGRRMLTFYSGLRTIKHLMTTRYLVQSQVLLEHRSQLRLWPTITL